MSRCVTTTPLSLLLAVALTGGATHVEGTVHDNPGNGKGRQPGTACSAAFILIEAARCYIQHFVSPPTHQVCGQEFQEQTTEAYRCFHTIFRHCHDQLGADADEDFRLFLQELEEYMIDPDLLGEYVHDVCESKDEILQCLDDDSTPEVAACWVHEIQTMLFYVEGWIRGQLSIHAFGRASCMYMRGLQQCTVNHMQHCPQIVVRLLQKLWTSLMLPHCHADGGRMPTDQGRVKGTERATKTVVHMSDEM